MIVLLESLHWFLASHLTILYLPHTYTNLPEPLWLKRIVGFTNKEAEKFSCLVVSELWQGSSCSFREFCYQGINSISQLKPSWLLTNSDFSVSPPFEKHWLLHEGNTYCGADLISALYWQRRFYTILNFFSLSTEV